jgi:hypothetical protein
MWKRLFGKIIDKEVTEQVDLAVRALDDRRDIAYRSYTYPRDRHSYDRDEILADALEAWRVNPLARRIINMMTQYVVGGGIGVGSNHERTNKFITEWWEHRLNRMATRVYEWCDELSRSGDLFVVIATDAAGMSYVRAVPGAEIQDIETADNDIEQELAIVEMTCPPKTDPDRMRETVKKEAVNVQKRKTVHTRTNHHPIARS